MVLSALQRLNGKKTYIVSLVTVLYAVVVNGWSDNNWKSVVPYLLTGSLGATLRHAIAKLPAPIQTIADEEVSKLEPIVPDRSQISS